MATDVAQLAVTLSVRDQATPAIQQLLDLLRQGVNVGGSFSSTMQSSAATASTAWQAATQAAQQNMAAVAGSGTANAAAAQSLNQVGQAATATAAAQQTAAQAHQTAAAGATAAGAAHANLANQVNAGTTAVGGNTRAWISLGAAVSSLPGPLGAIGSAFGAIHMSIQPVQAAMLGIGAAMATASSVLASGFSTAIDEARQFQRTMAEVQVVTSATTEQMVAMTAAALQVGVSTQYNSQQAAKGLYELGSAGLTVREALTALPPITTAAMLGNRQLGDTTKDVVNGLRQFNLEAGQTGHVVDVMTVAVQGSVLHWNEVGSLWANLRGRASQLQLGMEDIVAAEMLMVNAGIPAAAASSAIGTAVDRLSKQSGEAAKGLAELGIHAFNSEGEFQGLLSIYQQLEARLPEMTQQQQAHALSLLGGSRAAGAFSAVLTQQMNVMTANGEETKHGADLYKYWVEQLKNADGAAQHAKEVIEQTLDYQMKVLGGSIQEAGVQIGRVFLPALQAIVPVATGAVNAFLQLPEAVRTTSVVMAVAATGMLSVASALQIWSVVGPIVIPLLGSISGALLGMAAPIAAVVLASAALSIAWQTDFLNIQEHTHNAVGAVSTYLSDLRDDVDVTAAYIGKIQLPKLGSAAKATADELGLGGIGQFFSDIGDTANKLAQATGTDAGKMFKLGLITELGLMGPVGGLLANLFRFDELKQQIEAQKPGMQAALKDVMTPDEQAGALDAMAMGAISKIKDGANLESAAMTAMWDQIRAADKKGIDATGESTQENLDLVIARVTELMKKGGSGIGHALASGIAGSGNAVQDSMNALLEETGSLPKAITSAIQSRNQEAAAGLLTMAAQQKVVASAIENSTAAYKAQLMMIEQVKGPVAALNQVYADGHITLPQYQSAMAGIVLTTKEEASAADTAEKALKKMHDAMTPGQKVFEQQAQSVLQQLNQGVSIDIKAKLADYGQGKTAQDQLAGILQAANAPGITLTDLYYGTPAQNADKLALLAAALQGGGAAKLVVAAHDQGKQMGQALASGVEEAKPAVAAAVAAVTDGAAKAAADGAATIAQGFNTAIKQGVSTEQATQIGQQFALDIASGMSFSEASDRMKANIAAALADVPVAPLATSTGATYMEALANRVAQGGPELGQAGTALAAGLNTAVADGLGPDDAKQTVDAFKAAVRAQLGTPTPETEAIAENLGSQLEKKIAEGLSPEDAAKLAIDYLNGLGRTFSAEGKTAEQHMSDVAALLSIAMKEGLKPESAVAIGVAFISGVVRGIAESGNIGPALDASTQTGLEQVRSTWGITGTTSTRAASDVGQPIAGGIADGIIAGSPAINAAAEAAVDRALEAARRKAGIESPSKVMAEQVGVPLAEGIAEGFKAGMQSVETAVTQSVQGIMTSAGQQLTDGWSAFTQDWAAKTGASSLDNKNFPMRNLPQPLDVYPPAPPSSPFVAPNEEHQYPDDAMIAGVGRGRGLLSILGGSASLQQLLGGMNTDIQGQGVDPTITKAIADAVEQGTTVAYALLQSRGGPGVTPVTPITPPPLPPLVDAQGRPLSLPMPPTPPRDPSGAYGNPTVTPAATTTRSGGHMQQDPRGGSPYWVQDPTTVQTTQTFPGGQGMGGASGLNWVAPPGFNLQEAVRLTLDRTGLSSPYLPQMITDTVRASGYQINPMNQRTGMGGGISGETESTTTQQRLETPQEILNRMRPNAATMANLLDPNPMRQFMGGGVGSYVNGQFVPAPDELVTQGGITGYISAGQAARQRAVQDPTYQAAYAQYQQQVAEQQAQLAAQRAAEIESTRVYNEEVKGRQDAMLASLSEQGVDPIYLTGSQRGASGGLTGIVRQEAQNQVQPGYDPQQSADRIQNYLQMLADPTYGRPALQPGMSDRLAQDLEANQAYLDRVASHNAPIGNQPAGVNMAYYNWTGQAAQDAAGLDIPGPRGYAGGGAGGGAPTGTGAPNMIRDPATGRIYYQFNQPGALPIERGSPDATPAEMTPSLTALLDRISGKYGYSASGQALTQQQSEQGAAQYQQSLAYTAAGIRRVGDSATSMSERFEAVSARFGDPSFGRVSPGVVGGVPRNLVTPATGPAVDLTPLAAVTGRVIQASEQMGTTMSSIVDQFTICRDAAGTIQSVFDATGKNVTSQFTTLSNDLGGNVQRYQDSLTRAEQSTGDLSDLARDIHLSAAAGATSAADIAGNFKVCLDAAGSIQSVFTSTGEDITQRFASLGGDLTTTVQTFFDQFASKAGTSIQDNVLNKLTFGNTANLNTQGVVGGGPGIGALTPGGGSALLPGNVNPNDYTAPGPYGQSPYGVNPYASTGPYSPFAPGPLGYASTPGNPQGWGPAAGMLANAGISYGSVSSQSFLDAIATDYLKMHPNSGLAVNAQGQSVADVFDAAQRANAPSGQGGGSIGTSGSGAASVPLYAAVGNGLIDPGMPTREGGTPAQQAQTALTLMNTSMEGIAKDLIANVSLANFAWGNIADTSVFLKTTIAGVAGAFNAMPAGGFPGATSAIAAVQALGYKTPGLGDSTVNSGGSGPSPTNGASYGAQSYQALLDLEARVQAQTGFAPGSDAYARALAEAQHKDEQFIRVVGKTTDTLADYQQQMADSRNDVFNLSHVMNQLGDAYGSGIGVAAQLATAQARLAAATAGAAAASVQAPAVQIPGYTAYQQPGGGNSSQSPTYYTPTGTQIANTIATTPGPNGTTLSGVNVTNGSQQAMVNVLGVLVPAGASSNEVLAILAAHGVNPQLPNNPLDPTQIPVYGEGGLVSSRTLAIVGDTGPELIVPVNQLQNGSLSAPLSSMTPTPQLASTAGTRFSAPALAGTRAASGMASDQLLSSGIGVTSTDLPVTTTTGGFIDNPLPPVGTPTPSIGGLGWAADGSAIWNGVPLPGYEITSDFWLSLNGVRLTPQEVMILAKLKGVNMSPEQIYTLTGTWPPGTGPGTTPGTPGTTVTGTAANKYGPVKLVNSTGVSDFYQQPDGTVFSVPKGSGITKDQTGFGYGQRNLPVNLSGSLLAQRMSIGNTPAFIANPSNAPAGTRLIRTDDQWDTYIEPDGTIVQVPHGSVMAVDIGGKITWGPPVAAPVGSTTTATTSTTALTGGFPTSVVQAVGTGGVPSSPNTNVPPGTIPTVGFPTAVLPSPTFTGGIGVRGFADGGIAWSPQLAMVAEKGPERITPLSQDGAGGGNVQIGDINITMTPTGNTVADVATLLKLFRQELGRQGLTVVRSRGF